MPTTPSPFFATTRWSVVWSARAKGSPRSAEALEHLCGDYWYPLYAFVRRTGRNRHDAQDLTQAFFVRLLEKDWLLAAEKERGRFRSFLLMALKRFLANEWDRAQAAKRGGGRIFVPLDTALAEERYLAEPTAAFEAERLYERRWALTLLEQAMAELRSEYKTDGRGADFDRLKHCLTAERGTLSYEPIARDLAVSTGAARVAVHRIRKRFREIFRRTIADTVTQDGEVEDELRHVVGMLSQA